MKRTTYLVKDMSGDVMARIVAPEGEGVSLDPWMIEGINSQGWRVEAWETKESGVQIHGWADWQAVADSMAEVLTAILDDAVQLTEEESEALLGKAQQALDDYHVAQMEVSVAQPDAVPEDDEEEGDDAGGG